MHHASPLEMPPYQNLRSTDSLTIQSSNSAKTTFLGTLHHLKTLGTLHHVKTLGTLHHVKTLGTLHHVKHSQKGSKQYNVLMKLTDSKTLTFVEKLNLARASCASLHNQLQ